MTNDVFGMGDLEDLQRKIKGVVIDECGVWNEERNADHPFQAFGESHIENIRQAIQEIPKQFTRKKRGGMVSYEGKHHLEHWRDGNAQEGMHNYISNGAFIIAMMYCGYFPKVIKKTRKNHYSLNVWFPGVSLQAIG